MPSIIEVDTIKNKTGTQNTVLSTDGSGNNTLNAGVIKSNTGSNTGLTIASDGQITVNQNNPTLTLGTNATFPSGHPINKKILYLDTMLSSAVVTDVASFQNSGISGTYVPKANSSASFLIIEAHSSMAYQGTALGNGQTLVTMRTSDTTTYAANDFVPHKDGYHHYLRMNDTSAYQPYQCKWVYKAGTTGAYPVNLTSYSADTTYYFRVYIRSQSGDFVFGHVSSSIILTVHEFML